MFGLTQSEFFIAAVISLGFIVISHAAAPNETYAEQKVTIIPDAHSDTAIRFVDMVDYFLAEGEELTWFNEDFVDHELTLTNDDNITTVADLDLKSNVSASYLFEEPGKYYYFSQGYPKIQGSVRVLESDNISVQKITGLKNGVDVQLTWTPSQIALLNPDNAPSSSIGGNGGTQTGRADFIITFIDNKTGINQEHVDYRYTISDDTGNEVFAQGLHSTYGVEEATYSFEKPGNFKPQIIITNILFAPVDPDVADLDKPISVSES